MNTTDNPRNTKFQIRLTEDERRRIDEARGDVSLTAWIRRAILNRLQEEGK